MNPVRRITTTTTITNGDDSPSNKTGSIGRYRQSGFFFYNKSCLLYLLHQFMHRLLHTFR
jgi:hypothetical protein